MNTCVTNSFENECESVNYLGSIDCDKNSESPFIVNLAICNSNILFKIDTGADCTILSVGCYETLKQIPPLKKTLSVLKSPCGNVHCLGYFIAETYRNNKKYLFNVYEVKGNEQSNLLSRGASSAQILVKRIDENLQSIFGKTGLIDCDPVKIELKDDAVPYSVTTARRIHFPLLPKVQEELEQMLANGIMEQIWNRQTDVPRWCQYRTPIETSEFGLTVKSLMNL